MALWGSCETSRIFTRQTLDFRQIGYARDRLLLIMGSAAPREVGNVHHCRAGTIQVRNDNAGGTVYSTEAIPQSTKPRLLGATGLFHVALKLRFAGIFVIMEEVHAPSSEVIW